MKSLKYFSNPDDEQIDLLQELNNIDMELGSQKVDAVFLNKYYKLKKDFEVRTIFYPTTVLGVIVGLLASVMLNLSSGSIIGTIFSIALFIVMLAVIVKFLIPGFQRKEQCVLVPYKIRKMELIIDKYIDENRDKENNKNICNDSIKS